MEAIVFGFVAHIGWATSDIFSAVVSRKIGGHSTTFWSNLVRIPLLGLFLLLDLENLRLLTVPTFLLCGALAIIALIGGVCFFSAFQSGNASLVGTITSAFVVPTVILSVIFFGERLNAAQVFAIIVIVVGLVVTSLDFDSLRQRRNILDRSVALSLTAMMIWGVYYAFIRIPVEEIGWFLPSYIGYLFSPLVLVMMRWQQVPLQSPLAKKALVPFICMMLLSTAANLGYNVGISSGYTSIVAPIAASYPVLFVALSSWYFREPLFRQQMIGIMISLLGIVALTLLI